MSRVELVLACALAAGCTSVFGLDDVVSDFDHDGVADVTDVCPRDYDPLQADTNADGVGDACGPCGTSTQDLDGDGRDDGCDACIGAGAIGIDEDADGIDDGCDSCVGGVDTTGLDLDADGIPDGCDSCISSGFDGDSDGVDDACDVCLFGANNDEDLDGLADGCDVCPADADPDQAVSGTEIDIGSACDPDPGRNDSRRMFDGFGVVNEGIWPPNSEWQTHDGAAHVGAAAPGRTSFFTVRGEFEIRTAVLVAPGGDSTMRLGVEATSSNGFLSYYVDCGVDATGTLQASQGAPASVVLDVSQPVTVVLKRILAPDGDARGVCEAIDHAGTHAVITELTFVDVYTEATVGLLGSGPGQYDWVEAIDHPVSLP